MRMRKAFTLIEMMVSISILSIMMIFLYQSYASLNKSNSFYKKKVTNIKNEQVKKRVLFLDFSLALHNSVKITNQDRESDVVFMQSTNSLHKRYNPYVVYILKEKKLYRLESLKKINEYPLGVEDEYIVDYLGAVESFRVYKSNKKVGGVISEAYLVHIDFIEEEDILLKIKVLNEQ